MSGDDKDAPPACKCLAIFQVAVMAGRNGLQLKSAIACPSQFKNAVTYHYIPGSHCSYDIIVSCLCVRPCYRRGEEPFG